MLCPRLPAGNDVAALLSRQRQFGTATANAGSQVQHTRFDVAKQSLPPSRRRDSLVKTPLDVGGEGAPLDIKSVTPWILVLYMG